MECHWKTKYIYTYLYTYPWAMDTSVGKLGQVVCRGQWTGKGKERKAGDRKGKGNGECSGV